MRKKKEGSVGIYIFNTKEKACLQLESCIKLYVNMQPRAKDERRTEITSDIVQVSVPRHLTFLSFHFLFCKIRRGKLHSNRLQSHHCSKKKGFQPDHVRAVLTLLHIIILTALTTRKQCQLRESNSFSSWVLPNTFWLLTTGNTQKALPWWAAWTGRCLFHVSLMFLMNKTVF